MVEKLKISNAVAAVLACFLEDADADRYGMDLMRDANLPSGTLYPILARLAAAGWVSASWEDIDPEAEGRPARRYYRLTPDGAVAAHAELAKMHNRLSKVLGHKPGTQPGWGSA